MSGTLCPRCGREQPETSTSGTCSFCGAEVAAAPESIVALLPPPPPPPDAPLAVPPPPAPDAAEEAEAGKRSCPGCSEVLYDTEQRCWRCGHEFEPPAPPEESAPEAAPAPPPPPNLTATVPVAPLPPPASAATEARRQARALGVWSLVVGLIGLFGCLGAISPLALYLGVRANRTGDNSLGTAGMVLGIIGTVMLVITAAVLIAGLFTHTPSSQTGATSPDVLLPSLRLWL